MTVYTLHRGHAPLLVSLPHVGIELPDDQRWRYVERAFGLEDTDWHLEKLYGFVRELDASLIVPRYSRYLIDLNRPREDTSMYPGMNNTELCPTRFFSGDALYRDDSAPGSTEIMRRIEHYWQPYHDALRVELDRLRRSHGHVILFDGHSIKSELPWLFDGRLPDLNLGTANGASCAPTLRSALARVLVDQSRFSQVVDGRFKGGYTTRHYGDPDHEVHAIQLEMCWSCYMQETAAHAYDPQRAGSVQPILRELMETMLAWRPDG